MEGTTSVRISQVRDGTTASTDEVLAVEEPLEIRLAFPDGSEMREKTISITMRTPGSDFELASGFLFSEGIITSAAQIESIRHCGKTESEQKRTNVVRVALAPGVAIDWKRLERHFYTASSCGVCGKTSIEAVGVTGSRRLGDGPRVDGAAIQQMPALLRKTQPLFEETGGLHAAGLFSTNASLIALAEDVGRHNALDKLIGGRLMRGDVPLSANIVMLSGRASFELIQKALVAGVPIVAAVGAPSSLAVELATEYGMTLVGFVRENRFNIYSHPERVVV